MTKQELLKRMMQQLPPDLTRHLNQKSLGTVVDAAFAELATFFVRAKVTHRTAPRFAYPGFGTFTKKTRRARTGRNPQTGELITIPEQVTITFSPGQELKRLLNRAQRRIRP
jgi:DNA-binding protein HU-beta